MRAMRRLQLVSALVLALLACGGSAFTVPGAQSGVHTISRIATPTKLCGLWAGAGDGAEQQDDADRLQKQAEKLRQQIREMEAALGDERKQRDAPPPTQTQLEEEDGEKTLVGKRILVAGANGRLGSMVCRHLLRNNPKTEVVAMCHYIGEESATARGYARLSYEVGAEYGIGTLGAAWSSGDERNASFEWHEGMRDYNLNNLRIVECELLDPVQCSSVVEGCDAVIWCATDFNGSRPRAVSGLNIAFLFRAVTVPDKGRVEVEGLENMLGALKRERQERLRRKGRTTPPANDPINFVLVSTAPEALGDFETPYGSFSGIKRRGEELMKEDFPSVSSTVLQMGKYEDNFVEEGMDVIVRDEDIEEGRTRWINRRDAARAAVEALTNDDLVGKTSQVWTVIK